MNYIKEIQAASADEEHEILIKLGGCNNGGANSSTQTLEMEEEEDEPVYNFDVEHACVGTYGGPVAKPVLFPPAIPSVVTSAGRRSYTPWKMERVYTDDGRLVITKVPVKHQEYYFRSEREDGRLRLHMMVPAPAKINAEDEISKLEVETKAMKITTTEEEEDMNGKMPSGARSSSSPALMAVSPPPSGEHGYLSRRMKRGGTMSCA